ncbi:MAG TPA: alkene reductase [Bacteroidales bacterium]|nr:alkene reductase [Bacteroidales bacterium]
MMLFEKYNLAGTTLANRIVMAPLTRRRAEEPELAANELIAEYYRQRATAGLIISEGSQVSPQGYGYSGSPGCYSQPQIEGWKIVTKTVHEAGGKIFLQLWHVGPFSHRLLQPNGDLPLSASAVQPPGEVLTPQGRLPYELPKPMTTSEIYQSIRDFGQAAQNAMTAGFDGVEIHGAHAYIIDQFIMDSTNHRTDEFGGIVANRSKFLFLVIEEILKYLPPEKVGLRLSPEGYRPGLFDSDARKTFGYIIEKLNEYRLTYLHLSEQMTPEERIENAEKSFVPYYRSLYRGTLLSCGGHSGESARRMLDEGHADLIVFGKPFISNPDLVERLRINAPLTAPEKATFYHGGATGYTDYPAMNQTANRLD